MSLWSKLFSGQSAAQHTLDSPEQIQQNIADGKAVMLDVRSQEEWDAGHLKDVIYIPITAIKSPADCARESEKLDRGKIIYCH